jgi:predicted ArsR family transcriptional regulator
MEMANQPSSMSYLQRGPAGDILSLLQRNGPMSIKELRSALGVRSLNAVREPLMSLMAAGLVHASSVRQAAGRPAYVYTLSDKAQALFPKGYDVLLKLVLEEVAEQAGNDGLRTLLAGVSARLAARYGSQDEAQTLHERLAVLAQAYEAHGTPIALVEAEDALTLHEYTCPYFSVAQETRAVCQIEQHMLEQVLGRKVELTQRIVDGHTACRFVVEQSLDGTGSSAGDTHPAT